MKIVTAIVLTAVLASATAFAEPAAPAGTRLIVGVSGMH